jgi:hypothetical protein
MMLRALVLALLVGAAAPAAAGGEAPGATPETTISSGPAAAVASSSATFVFTSSVAGSRFACALDEAAFSDCTSPFTLSAADGEHHFYVIAVSPEDNTDPTPAVWTWTADTSPPTAVRRHRAVVRYRRLVLAWGSLSAAGADVVAVLRSTRRGQAPTREVYRGSGSSYADANFRNGIYHRYRIVAFDRAGNASPAVDVVVDEAALLVAPKNGALVSAPPRLRWRAAPRAAYYNVQLYRRGAKLLSVWPRSPLMQLSSSWRYLGHRYRLAPGHYAWFVWPGFGPLARGSYGSLIGQGAFDVRR